MFTTVPTPCDVLCRLGINTPRNISKWYSFTTAEFRKLKVEQLENLGFRRGDARRIYNANRTGIFAINPEETPEIKSKLESTKIVVTTPEGLVKISTPEHKLSKSHLSPKQKSKSQKVKVVPAPPDSDVENRPLEQQKSKSKKKKS